MKTEKTKLLLIAIMVTISVRLNSQNGIVNIDTVTHYGTTDTLDYMPIIINTNGNVVVAGNQKVSATQYDALMAEQTSNAVNVWVNSFNTSNQKAFITSSVRDQSGNVYSAGGIRTATSNGTDFLVIKRNNSGALVWTYYYDGPGNSNDIATSICLDPNSGHLYVTGASDGTFTCLTDYATVKINKLNGGQMWVSRYNFFNSFDVPTSVIYNPDIPAVVVTGSSGNSPTDYDIATLKYNPNSGAQLGGAHRTANNGVGEDKPFGMVTDSLGNIYYVGSVYNGNNYNAQVTKLDTSLIAVWSRTLDLNGFDDAALGLALDDSLNIYVVGTSNYSSTNKELFLAKYNNAGTNKWVTKRKADPNSTSDAEGLRIIVKNDNEIFVGGNFKVNGNQDIVLLRFDKNGRQTIERTYNGQSNGKDQFMDFTISNYKIFVSARSFNGTDDDNIVIHFNYQDLSIIPITNTVTNNFFVKEEVIIRFNKAALKMSKINSKDIIFGELGDFVNDSTCTKIQSLLDPVREFGLSAKKIPTRKLDLNFTENDTLSLSRLGDYVKIPQFYASLILTLPSNINTENAALNLGSIKPDLCFSQLNNLYTFDWVPNDTLYQNKQTSLHTSTLYPNAHINVEKAWDYTTGQSFVRTGVFDSGIETTGNVDLQGITEEHDYNQQPYSNYAPGYNYHGTSVAGVIGAKTNNINGVSGIAAGNNVLSGVTVVVMKIGDYVITTDQNVKAAYSAGATGSTLLNTPFQALHIMNSSFGKKNAATSPLLIEAVEYCNLNGVAFIASRGNFVANATPTLPINSTNQPATLRPRITMNVGASGYNGNNHVDGYNGSGFTTFRGNNIDFMAPGAKENVYTTYNYYQGAPSPPSSAPLAPNSYTNFSGTSSAAPHVAGVVSLMMSYRNQPSPVWNNLVHEDCEAILKRTATDQTLSAFPYFQGVGNDTISGYGKINADSALSCLQPKYKIRHIDLTHYSTSSNTSTNVIATNVVRYWPGSAVYGAGNYSVDVIEYTVTYNYNFASEIFIDAWPLHKASNGHPNIGATEMSDENYYSEVVSATTTSATLKTYTYKFNYKASPPYTNYFGQTNPQINALKAAFTLYTEGDPNEPDLTGVDEKETKIDYFNVYPNPSTGNFTLGFSSVKNTRGNVRLTNIMGTTVYENHEVAVKSGINRFDLTVNNLPKGVYFINLDVDNNKTLVKKVIIN